MENAVVEVITNYEPRAVLLRVVINENPDMHSVTVTIAFRTKNDPTPIVLDVVLERVR